MRREFSRIVRIVGFVAVALTVIGFMAACAKPVSKDYAIVFKNTGNPYGDKQMSGFKAGIEEQGFKAILQAPAQPTAEAQIQIIESLISQKVAAICIVGNDFDALQPVLTKAKTAGIKVFSLDSANLTEVAPGMLGGQPGEQADTRQPGGLGEDRQHAGRSSVRHVRRGGRHRHPVGNKPGVEPESLDRLHEEGSSGSQVREAQPREDRLR